MAIHNAAMAMSVVIAVKANSDMNVLDSFSLSLLAAAISLTPTVVIPIIEMSTK
jgi:hypothetical protein